MPANQHLDWVEIRDFGRSGGLWTRNTYLMPTDAAQQMDDCYPQIGGGLRAFFRSTAVSMTGINTTLEHPLGFHVSDFVDHQADGELLLMTQKPISAASDSLHLYATGTANQTWVDKKTITASTSMKQTVFQQYFTVADEGSVAFNFDSSSQLFIYTKAGTFVALPAGHPPFAVHQDRLVFGVQGSSGIRFTNPQSTTESTASPILINQVGQRTPAYIISFSPSDLLVGVADNQWAVIQGDLADPTVRLMNSSPTPNRLQGYVRVSGGAAFAEIGGGIFITADGTDFQQIDQNLVPPLEARVTTTLSGDNGQGPRGLGQMLFEKHFLFTPRGFVYDFRTKSWFRMSVLAATATNDGAYYYAERRSMHSGASTDLTPTRAHRFYACTSPTDTGNAWGVHFFVINENDDFDLPSDVSGEGTDGPFRVTDYTWRSAPLRSPDGRQIEIREIQILTKHVGGTGTNQLTVTVTDESGSAVAITKTVPGSSGTTSVLPFLFAKRGDYLDIKVRSQDTSMTGIEAPTIESIRIGTRSGHLLN